MTAMRALTHFADFKGITVEPRGPTLIVEDLRSEEEGMTQCLKCKLITYACQGFDPNAALPSDPFAEPPSQVKGRLLLAHCPAVIAESRECRPGPCYRLRSMIQGSMRLKFTVQFSF